MARSHPRFPNKGFFIVLEALEASINGVGKLFGGSFCQGCLDFGSIFLFGVELWLILRGKRKKGVHFAILFTINILLKILHL